MGLYYFTLKTDKRTFVDQEGEEFSDKTSARAHAEVVARELMQDQEKDTRFWRILVHDDYLEPCGEVFFVTVDRTVTHLSADLRRSIEATCRRAAALNDAIGNIRSTYSDLRSTLAEANRLLTYKL